MTKVALLCSGTTCPDKIFKEDIIVRVNLCKPRKDKRTDIWIFGDGYNYDAEKHNYTGEFIGYSACSGKGWFKRYPNDMFQRLKCSLQGFQPSIGTMALEYLLSLNYEHINVYGMDFFKTGYFYDDRPRPRITKVHNFFYEEEYVKGLMQKNKGVKIMAVKKIKNKAVQEPRMIKEVKTAKKLGTIKCKTCGFKMADLGIARSCPSCNRRVV